MREREERKDSKIKETKPVRDKEGRYIRNERETETREQGTEFPGRENRPRKESESNHKIIARKR